MTKNMYEFKVLFKDEIKGDTVRSYKVCGGTLDIAIQKFTREFPTAILFKHIFLYSYED